MRWHGIGQVYRICVKNQGNEQSLRNKRIMVAHLEVQRLACGNTHSLRSGTCQPNPPKLVLCLASFPDHVGDPWINMATIPITARKFRICSNQDAVPIDEFNGDVCGRRSVDWRLLSKLPASTVSCYLRLKMEYSVWRWNVLGDCRLRLPAVQAVRQ